MESFTSQHVPVQGIRVHYRAIGEGFPVVYIHGLGGSSELWQASMRAVADAGLRAIAVDLPGHGLSDDPLPGVDLTDGAAFLQEFLDALDIPRCVLIGGSAGGLVATQATLNHSQRIAALVLVGSAGLAPDLGFAYRLLSFPLLGDFFGQPWYFFGRTGLRSILYDHTRLTNEFLHHWLQHRRRPGGNRPFLNILRAAVNLKGVKSSVVLQSRLPEIAQPVLLMWGSHDHVVPPKVGPRVQPLFPDAQLVMVERSGHWPHVEQPDEFNRHVIPFAVSHSD